MSYTYRILCLSTAISPITHMAGVEGNEAMLNRQPIMTPLGRRQVPVLSGNSLRHRTIRDPLATHLIQACGLEGSCKLRFANFVKHGGALSESTARVDLGRKLEMQTRMPFVRLLGGAMPDSIEEGSLRCDQGVLVCRENATRIAKLTQMDVPENLRPSEDCVGPWQYTRGDAVRTASAMLGETTGEAESNLMIYAGQAVIPGAMFLHGFTLEHAGELEIGAVLLGLALWQQAGGSVGGMAAKGHGKLKTQVMLPDGMDGPALMQKYAAHVVENADWVRSWAATAFEPKAEPAPKRGKKGADHVAA